MCREAEERCKVVSVVVNSNKRTYTCNLHIRTYIQTQEEGRKGEVEKGGVKKKVEEEGG